MENKPLSRSIFELQTQLEMAAAAASDLKYVALEMESFRDSADNPDLRGLISAVRSINFSRHQQIEIDGDDEPCFWQRKEWIEWILELADVAEHRLDSLSSPWQPIETVPPTDVLLLDEAGEILSGRVDSDREFFVRRDPGSASIPQATVQLSMDGITHWMPKPGWPDEAYDHD